jgi:hypothetical protein
MKVEIKEPLFYNEGLVKIELRKFNLQQLKGLYRAMKKEKSKTEFGFQFNIKSKLQNISYYTKYEVKVLCQIPEQEKVHEFVFIWSNKEIQYFEKCKKIIIQNFSTQNNIKAEFIIYSIKILQTPKQIFINELREILYQVFCTYVIDAGGYVFVPAMEYEEWSKGNYGYEKLVPTDYTHEYKYDTAIKHCLNYINYIRKTTI